MSPEAAMALLRETFPDAVEETRLSTHPCVRIRATDWPAVARFLRDDPRTACNWLRCISGVDLIEDGFLAAIYELHSVQPGGAGALWQLNLEIAVEVRVPRGEPRIPSVADVWPAADWHERETFDLLGIVFEGHPDLCRILCCDDWVGHPLRKDYEFPLEYNGIPAVTEFNQTRPRH